MATTNGIAPVFTDELAHQFSNTEYFSTHTFNSKRPATMKAGYWDQNIRTPGSFFPRNGGTNYRMAWEDLISAQSGNGVEPPIYHVYIESWNEYDEGTGIYAADPSPPFVAPENQSGNNHEWSQTANAREYIDITYAGAALFNGNPDLDSQILWHNFPNEIATGSSTDVGILIRNSGNSKWSSSRGIHLGQSDQDSHIWGPARVSIEDGPNEVAKFGGVFRGDPCYLNSR